MGNWVVVENKALSISLDETSSWWGELEAWCRRSRWSEWTVSRRKICIDLIMPLYNYRYQISYWWMLNLYFTTSWSLSNCIWSIECVEMFPYRSSQKSWRLTFRTWPIAPEICMSDWSIEERPSFENFSYQYSGGSTTLGAHGLSFLS